MKFLVLLTFLVSCDNAHSTRGNKKVKVVEIIEMRGRSTIFMGDDGHPYEVNQGNYKKGDLMDCFYYHNNDSQNYCQGNKIN